MPTIYDLIAKIGWDANTKEIEKAIDLTKTQGKMVDELRLKGGRLEQQMVKTNDPVKLKKYNDELQKTRKQVESITTATKKQADQVELLKTKQKQFTTELQKASDPKIVQGLLRGLMQVENQLSVINRQATVLPAKVGGIGKDLLMGFTGGLVGGGIVGAITLASNAISGFFSDSIQEAADAEQGLLKFKQTLDNLGQGQLFDELVSNADNLAKSYKNLFDNDDILAGQAKFIEGTRVSKDQLKQLIPVAIELAAKLGTDVTTASEMLTNAIIGRTSPELKRLGLNMKGVGTETGRVSEITGDFAKLLSGGVETALQTATGSTKQLRQELANMEEDLGRKLLPLQKKLTQFKISLVTALSLALESDKETQLRQIDEVADAYTKKLAPAYKNQKALSQESIKESIISNEKSLEGVNNALTALSKLSAYQKQFRKDAIAQLNDEQIILQGKLKALRGMVATEGKTAINPNAGAGDPTAKEKKTGETAEQRTARLKREAEEQARIIEAARLSLLEEEAREIAIRTNKYDDELKKIKKASLADRLIFEEAFQKDLDAIHEKYNLKELARLDKQIEDINQKAYDAAKERILIGAKEDQAKRDLQKDNLKAMQDFIKAESDAFKEGENERKKGQQELIQNTLDLIAVGQQLLQQEINRTQKQIGLQEDRVESARKSSTASVKIEEDRLNELIAKRKKYEQAQRVIDAAVVVANQAVAISGAIRTIATSGNPALIAANVIAIAAGIAASTLAVRNAISDDGFKEGGYTGDGNPNEVSRAQGKRGYKYHKGEFVMNADLTGKHRDMFEGIHKGELMVKQLNDGYYIAPSIDVDSAVSDATATRYSFDVSTMVSELQGIKTLLMQREIKVNNNFDADGFGQSVSGQLNSITLRNLLRK